MADYERRHRGAAGFTLIEVLASLAILALVGVAVTAISLTGVIQIEDDNQERQADATAAQFASVFFARDVQGASRVVAPCDPTAPGTHLVTLRASDQLESVADDVSRRVEYRSIDGPDSTFQLIRVECGGVQQRVVDGLEVAPVVECDGLAPCAVGSRPRVVTLSASRTATFDFELDGARRTNRQTNVNGEDPDPLEVPNFVALGGSTPLLFKGGGTLTIRGSAYINAPAPGDVVQFNGASGLLDITGDFAIQTGGTCEGGCANSTQQPTSYPVALPDPLRFLPAPSTTGLSTWDDCPKEVVDGEDRRVCQPGIYNVAFPPSIGPANVKDFILEPGIYILRNGLDLQGGSLRGEGVLLYNESGSIAIGGGAEFDLSSSLTGTYRNILLFQARNNLSTITITGNSAVDVNGDSVAELVGTMYAPASAGFELGSGNGSLTVGRVVGTSLSVQGNGNISVGGS